MKITIIGAGRAANFLIRKFQLRTVNLYQIYNRTGTKAEALSQKYGGEYIANLNDLDPNPDAVFFAVSDSIVQEIASQIDFGADTLLINMSGSNDTNLFSHAENWCTIWPIYSLNDTSYLKEDIPVALSFPDNPKLKSRAEKIAYLISNTIFELNDEQRAYAHLAAVIANNFVNFLNTQMFQMLKEHQIDPKLITSIMTQTYENSIRQMDASELTGPAKRGDHTTIDKHIGLLQDKPDLQQIYQLISKAIIDKS